MVVYINSSLYLYYQKKNYLKKKLSKWLTN